MINTHVSEQQIDDYGKEYNVDIYNKHYRIRAAILKHRFDVFFYNLHQEYNFKLIVRNKLKPLILETPPLYPPSFHLTSKKKYPHYFKLKWCVHIYDANAIRVQDYQKQYMQFIGERGQVRFDFIERNRDKLYLEREDLWFKDYGLMNPILLSWQMASIGKYIDVRGFDRAEVFYENYLTKYE